MSDNKPKKQDERQRPSRATGGKTSGGHGDVNDDAALSGAPHVAVPGEDSRSRGPSPFDEPPLLGEPAAQARALAWIGKQTDCCGEEVAASVGGLSPEQGYFLLSELADLAEPGVRLLDSQFEFRPPETRRFEVLRSVDAAELTSGTATRERGLVEREKSAARGKSREAVDTEQGEDLETLAPGLRKAFDQLVGVSVAAQREASRAARAAAWKAIAANLNAWNDLLPAEARSTELVSVAADGRPLPREDVQAWLDRVHDAVHANGPGHFDNYELNKAFADQLRALLLPLGLRLEDPKTGLPGMLYHRSGGGSPGGQFYIEVTDLDGRRKTGFARSRIPQLRLADDTKP